MTRKAHRCQGEVRRGAAVFAGGLRLPFATDPVIRTAPKATIRFVANQSRGESTPGPPKRSCPTIAIQFVGVPKLRRSKHYRQQQKSIQHLRAQTPSIAPPSMATPSVDGGSR